MTTVLATAVLTAVAWSMTSKLAPIQKYLSASTEVDRAIIELESLMIGDDSELKLKRPELRDRLSQITHSLERLAQQKAELDLSPDTDSRLLVAEWNLSLGNEDSELTEAIIEEGLYHLRFALGNEIAQRAKILKTLEKRNRWVHSISIAAALSLMLTLIVMVFLIKNRFFKPLNDLRKFLRKVQRRQYTTFDEQPVDSLIQPLVSQYNQMVKKLQLYEKATQEKQKNLEDEVRNASKALFEQQYALFRAQQQAAAGEISASIAHEIRNPMAGMSMALESLKDDLTDNDHTLRINMVIDELNRIKRLLNNVIDKTKLRPDEISTFNLYDSLNSLVKLASYQIADSVKIVVDIPKQLQVTLPEPALRQAILNLVLNAAQSVNKNGSIIVTAKCDTSKLQISVRDDGSGFSKHFLTQGIRLYDTQTSGGSGIGLATVKRFAQNQDGEIKLENSDNGGAIVTLIFPKKRCKNNE